MDKLCIDCNWCCTKWGLDKSPRCALAELFPGSHKKNNDHLVMGSKYKPSYYDMGFCSTQRDDYETIDTCGSKGKNWEPKEPKTPWWKFW